MSVASKPYYWLVCDYPGCGISAQEGSDYSAMSDESAAYETAEGLEWACTDDGDFCYEHSRWTEEDEGEGLRVPIEVPPGALGAEA